MDRNRADRDHDTFQRLGHGISSVEEERLKLALDVAALGTIIIDYTNDVCKLDEVAARLFGLDHNNTITRSELHDRIHVDDLAEVMRLIDRVLEPTGDGTFAIEHRVQLPSGGIRWLSIKKKVVFRTFNGKARPTSGLVVVMDVTARRCTLQSLQEHNQQLALLGRVSQQLILKPDPGREILRDIFADTAQTVGADVYLNYESGGEPFLKLSTWNGLKQGEHQQFATIRIGESLCGRVALNLKPIIIEDICNKEFERSEVVKAAGYGAYAGFPLLAGDRLLGIIAFLTRTRTHFRPGDIATIQAVCSLVSTTLERSHLANELR